MTLDKLPRRVRRERERKIRRMQKAGWLFNPAYEASIYEEVIMLTRAEDAAKHGMLEWGVAKVGGRVLRTFSFGLFPKRFTTAEAIEEIPPFIRP